MYLGNNERALFIILRFKGLTGMAAGSAVTATGGMTAAAFVFDDGGNDKGNDCYEYY